MKEKDTNQASKKEGTFLSDFFGVLREKTLMRTSKYQENEHVFLLTRNIFVVSAAILFITSFFLEGDAMHYTRAVGYICGAVAYFSEILMETDGLTKKPSYDEMFMAYWFCPLYIMMAVSYVIEALK